MTADDVQARWRARRAPDGDLVLFGDGTLAVMELQEFTGSPQWEWREIVRARQWTAAHWIDVDLTLASCDRAGSRALAGESAAHGSIGWVALTRDGGDTLEWLAVCRYSDPFAVVELDDTAVTATSTAGQVWRFPRSAPERVAITSAPR
ncbi:hypothetical protein [Actinoallomurus iriomotensis]|uniref:Uncharacterized protein n=1 Tax=Actinoallomurus iriomotensis TaxID=478107 RepID=A0A9W6RQK4_9ACTN|nr:hypothetical protein [Actinoallomurus iriomotensis]GLY79948.1 hypothetical protein Airi01_082150 [Actinoallomurus iriomotensis]